ncbi:MAG: ABC transporter permease [Cumulibacter sp.]
MTPRRWLALIPALLVIACALVGPSLTVASTTTPVGGPFQPPSGAAVLGTELLGRDALARVLAGGRTLIVQALAATVLGSMIGMTIVVWAGTAHRSRAAAIVTRVVDGIAALPALLLLLLLAAGFPSSDIVVAIAIAVVGLPFSVRVIRERSRSLAATDYARHAHLRGDPWVARVRFDILPGVLPVALAEAGIRFVAATQMAATAGFLGLGAGAPVANWGRMVRENSVGLDRNPLPVLVPALALVMLAVTVTALIDRVSVTSPTVSTNRRGGSR